MNKTTNTEIKVGDEVVIDSLGHTGRVIGYERGYLVIRNHRGETLREADEVKKVGQ